MADVRRVPPGRAGRQWLAARLHTARRAATLLDRKLRILRTEQERCVLLAERARESWVSAEHTAREWFGRATAIGGQRAVSLATPTEHATVSVEYATIMGLRYPVKATLSAPAAELGSWTGGSALVEAKRAYEVALAAAASYAAATTAKRIVDREAAVTRQRLHAITSRWIPRLEDSFRDLTQRLEELERTEIVQLRWASARRETWRDRP
jgi:V/A-type H+-transporting ATPase subunit D